ncbi:MAG TPA: NGG1p interacting factor NIF3 [Candidatus Aminicenantes bacterium]|mgnify:CR=1 FL=1|nr:NGG1p interacting factor NIF3 [Candidatus Aminicenantes bacterium]
MRLDALYRKAVAVGIARDPRGPDEVRRLLEEERALSEKLGDGEREGWDPDRLFNPYADTRLLAGDPAAEVRRVAVGIDIDVAEVLLAHTLNRDRAAGIDAVVAHHPQGVALARLADVMRVQSDMLAAFGVAISVAEQLLDARISEVERRVLPGNHGRTVDAARLLGLPLVCVHTPADNCVSSHLAALFDRERPARLKDLVDLLRTIPEYRAAVRRMAGPKIVSGSENGRCGRIAIEMTGGTEGAKTVYDSYAASGVSTIVGMHISEEALENAKKARLNVVLAGHISSDTLGLNLLFDEVEKEAPLEFVGVSGFARTRAAER